jgi:hypothetical protein
MVCPKTFTPKGITGLLCEDTFKIQTKILVYIHPKVPTFIELFYSFPFGDSCKSFVPTYTNPTQKVQLHFIVPKMTYAT